VHPDDERAPEQGEVEPLASDEAEGQRGGSRVAVPEWLPLLSRPSSPFSARLGALLEVLVCSDFPTQLFIAQMLAFAGIGPFTSDHRYSVAFVVTLSLADAVLLVGLVLWFLYLHGERPSDVLFGRRPVWHEAIVGMLLIPIVFLLAIVALALMQQFAPSLHNVARNPLEALIRSPADIVLFAVVAVVSGGIREEVQRAFILHRFEQHLGGAPLGLVLFSLVFGAGHVIQGWDAVVTTATLGAFWGSVYLLRRSIAAPMVSHAGFDLAEIIRYTLYGP
jgi:membrane protease YdiL (CAAX protease family)